MLNKISKYQSKKTKILAFLSILVFYFVSINPWFYSYLKYFVVFYLRQISDSSDVILPQGIITSLYLVTLLIIGLIVLMSKLKLQVTSILSYVITLLAIFTSIGYFFSLKVYQSDVVIYDSAFKKHSYNIRGLEIKYDEEYLDNGEIKQWCRVVPWAFKRRCSSGVLTLWSGDEIILKRYDRYFFDSDNNIMLDFTDSQFLPLFDRGLKMRF